MAEAIAAIGAANSVAGLFNNAIACFRAVRVARSFEDGYQSALLDLANAELRLSRWGDAVGLGGFDPDEDVRLPRSLAKDKDREFAEQTLQYIVQRFQKAQVKAKKINPPAENEQADDQDYDFLAMFTRIRKMVNKRRSHAKWTTMAEWVIYNKGEFDDLINDIKKHTDNLVNAFPALAEKQATLCKAEVEDLTEALKALAKAAVKQDALLAGELSRMVEPVRDMKIDQKIDNKDTSVQNQGPVTGAGANFTMNSGPQR